ncbi:hypothetical protein RIF29_23045 [Crotalaria pallida]|uniref:Uncharacterized protein n=1 Tax=Crotalaria pallida TaxID=3830 RepID=A0AAN9F752_CROPI
MSSSLHTSDSTTERAKQQKGQMGVMCCCFEPRLALVHGKRKLRRLFRRVRADIKRKVKAQSTKKNFNFNYDPLSYSLNFDDDDGHFGLFCSTQQKENNKKNIGSVEDTNNITTPYTLDEEEELVEGLVAFLLLSLLLDYSVDFFMF